MMRSPQQPCPKNPAALAAHTPNLPRSALRLTAPPKRGCSALLWALGMIALFHGPTTPPVLAQESPIAPPPGPPRERITAAGTTLDLTGQAAGQRQGELSASDSRYEDRYYHVFTLRGNVGDQFRFKLQSRDFDPVITVIDAAGFTQAYDNSSPDVMLDDDGNLVTVDGPGYGLPTVDQVGERREAEVFVGLPGFGEYRVVVSTMPPGQIGSYTLTWEPITADNTVSVIGDDPEANRIAWGGFLMNKAEELRLAGLYAAALPFAEASLQITQESRLAQELGEETPTFARHFTQLADLYSKLGRYAEAEALYEQSLGIWQTFFGPEKRENTAAAQVLSRLGMVRFSQNQFEQAAQDSQTALEIYRTQLDIPAVRQGAVAAELNNLAAVYTAQGRYAEALPLLEQAVATNRLLRGEAHPTIALGLSNLADVYTRQGQLAQAAPLYQEAIAIQRQVYQAQHPDLAQTLNKLTRFHWQKDELDGAIAHLDEALAIEEANLQQLLVIGSERQKRDYFETIAASTDVAVSLHLQAAPERLDAAQLAFTTVLRRKGRILDAVSDNLRAIQQDLSPEAQQLLERLQLTRRQLANLVFNPPSEPSSAYQTEVSRLKGEADRLEAQLARLHQAEVSPTASEAVTISQVQQQIPTDAVLVEYVLYRPFDPQAEADNWGEPRYAAYLLTAQGPPRWVDLGAQAAIATQIRTFNRRLQSVSTDPNRVVPSAQALYATILAPILAQLSAAERQSVQHLLLSPDSQLNLVPFAALVDTNAQYLIETYQLTYLTSGRDLLRDPEAEAQHQDPLILADIDYGDPPRHDTIDDAINDAIAIASRNASLNQRRSSDALISVGPLANTAAEGRKIQQLFPEATLLIQNAATEGAIKQAQSPEILHIATHGFFLNIPQIAPTDLSTQFFSMAQRGDRPATSDRENPLLRSGLALAGFNQRRSGNEDGVLTALEVASLDLSATKLAVLSACETGLGEITSGEGVYGLRRALVIAGAESQVISLWQVDDAATQQLMVDYYTQLQQGVGRSEALRRVQLAMLQRGNYRAPFYWAAFIPSGRWGAL
ncbi:MAG: CHAT domain-containing tetratricopeptide repeat protein [Cyanobacteria bacterium P01_G01_bin.54]